MDGISQRLASIDAEQLLTLLVFAQFELLNHESEPSIEILAKLAIVIMVDHDCAVPSSLPQAVECSSDGLYPADFNSMVFDYISVVINNVGTGVLICCKIYYRAVEWVQIPFLPAWRRKSCQSWLFALVGRDIEVQLLFRGLF